MSGFDQEMENLIKGSWARLKEQDAHLFKIEGEEPFWDGDSQDICLLCRYSNDKGQVIGCDGCDHWYHFQCLKLDPNDPKVMEKSFYCPSCGLRRKQGLKTPLEEKEAEEKARRGGDNGGTEAVASKAEDNLESQSGARTLA